MITVQVLKTNVKPKGSSWPQYLVLCPECNKNKVTAERYHVKSLKQALKDKKSWDISYHYDYMMCDICNSNVQDLHEMDDKEEQEIKDRIDILENEYRNNQRKLEPKKNKYCSVKTLTKKEYQGYDEKTHKSINKNVKV